MNEVMRTDVPEQTAIRMMKLVSRLFGPAGDMQFAIPLLFEEPVQKKNTYDERVKFTYYGDTDYVKDHGGIITIASFIDEKEGVIYYGTSFCSPKDAYNKAIGKEIAFNDLAENMTVTSLGKKRHHDVNSRIMADLWASKLYPSWAEGTILSLLDYHINEMMNRG